MKLTLFEWEILAAGTEDKYGLFEIIGIARNVYPSLEDSELYEVARSTLQGLLRRGLIEMCWFTHHTNEEQEIRLEEADVFLSNENLWWPTNVLKEPYLAIGSTDAGVEVWYASPRPSKGNGSKA